MIQVDGDPSTSPYVQSMTLNGEPLDTPWLRHDQITAGGVLMVTVGDTPSDWGAGAR